MAHALSALVFALAGCTTALVSDDATKASRSRESKAATVEVIAEVLDFDLTAMWEHYSDGGFACFAGTRVRLLSPADLVGKELSLLHGNELPANSPWRRKGARLRFKLRRRSLRARPGSSVDLFADALEVEELADSR
jgi:hypothetical protein